MGHGRLALVPRWTTNLELIYSVLRLVPHALWRWLGQPYADARCELRIEQMMPTPHALAVAVVALVSAKVWSNKVS